LSTTLIWVTGDAVRDDWLTWRWAAAPIPPALRVGAPFSAA
jgi:hypothetical protein